MIREYILLIHVYIIGDHILVQPLTITANVLSTIGPMIITIFINRFYCYNFLGNYEDAYRMYKKALVISIGHLGSGHESLIQLYINFGSNINK